MTAKSKSQQRREAAMKDQPAPAPETQVAQLSAPVNGPASVRYAVAQATGLDVDSLGTDDGLGWFTSLQAAAAAQGFTIAKEQASVSIKSKHVGLFTSQGELQAAVFQGDDVVNNPTSRAITANRLTQRLRVTAAKVDEKTEE